MGELKIVGPLINTISVAIEIAATRKIPSIHTAHSMVVGMLWKRRLEISIVQIKHLVYFQLPMPDFWENPWNYRKWNGGKGESEGIFFSTISSAPKIFELTQKESPFEDWISILRSILQLCLCTPPTLVSKPGKTVGPKSLSESGGSGALNFYRIEAYSR